MPTRRPFDAIAAANFRVEIEGVTQGDFLSVGLLENATEVLVTRSGNDRLERKVPGRHRFANVVLRRLYTGDDALFNWRKLVLDGRAERKAGSIILAAADGSEILRFNFFEGWPCRWQLGRLGEGAEDARVIEEVEIAVEIIEKG